MGSLSRTGRQTTPGCEEQSESMTEDFTKTRRRSCFLLCISLLVVFGTVLGFLAGLLVGGLLAKQGHFASVLSQDGGLDTSFLSEDGSDPACPENSNLTRAGECGECGEARLLLVSGASYADCDGVYSLTNLTSVWDSKHIVYSRLGSSPDSAGDDRFIYWNSHFYGSNFYGWSIGDLKSLTESGPFHAQGRAGVALQPWLGSWNDNVTVSLISCRHLTNIN